MRLPAHGANHPELLHVAERRWKSTVLKTASKRQTHQPDLQIITEYLSPQKRDVKLFNRR